MFIPKLKVSLIDFEKDESTFLSLMDRVKQCYADSESIEAFLENAYELMKGAIV
jgi:hypothetical protein